MKFSGILGIDPGETTGLALVMCRKEGLHLVYTDEERDIEAIVATVQASRLWARPVCEMFVTRTVAANTRPIEIIGVLKYIVKDILELQTPADRKIVEQRYNTKKWGNHKGDALKHAVLYATRHFYAKAPVIFDTEGKVFAEPIR